ncbi:adenylate/guanylate cyclase domain-containing protein [Bradyrhizobium sp.]|uniref:adenylate/guanylate cyclase domain-containing protein n=1 Tax=Bradyrhizobium sp. TaxID=376 RepID=UPI0025C481D3|nr:adenylate/guanylate cyclase domain-containing protein [Bradyrhizobium sp.]
MPGQDQPVRVGRRLAAIVAADVAGYSRLMGLDEVGTARTLREHRAVTDALVAKHGGRLVKTTGDGVLLEFPSVVDAVECAVAVQAVMAERNEQVPPDRRMAFRIGVNLGDILIEGDDILGDGVNVAARLEGIAEPGGICISASAYDQVRGKVALEFIDLGDKTLKNIARPVRAYAVRIDDQRPKTTPSASSQQFVTTVPLPLPDKPSIAVLPFQNMSGDAEQEYFADGMVEDIITALSRFKSLFVIARNSSFTYKGKAVDIKQVGRELGVRYVLEGSVRRSGNRVRVTGQLIEASTDRHLWADKFDGPIDDVFDLQDRLTGAVVGLIAPQIEEAEIARARQKPTDRLDSYDFYLRGLAQHYNRAWPEARELFKKAFELDPEFAAAYAMAAHTFHGQVGAGSHPLTPEMRAEAIRLANAAVQIGSEDAFVLARCGHTLMFLGNEFDRGAAMVEKALSLNPNLATARFSLGWISVVGCDPERAIESFQSMIRFSPLDAMRVNSSAGLAWAYWLQGQYDEGYGIAKSVATVYPNAQIFGSLIANCVAAGRVDVARAAASELQKLDPTFSTQRALVELFPLRKPEFSSKLGEALRAAGLPE